MKTQTNRHGMSPFPLLLTALINFLRQFLCPHMITYVLNLGGEVRWGWGVWAWLCIVVMGYSLMSFQ